MSDSDADLELDGGESPEASTTPKKKGGLAALLPTILKFAAIGIGAVIFIVTVSYFTVRLTSSDGRSQTVTDPSSPYMGKRQVYSYYRDIGSITTKTRDTTGYTVTVVMNLGFDLNDTTTSSELTSRQLELRDFTRSYFTGKYAEDLQPENEIRLKQDILEKLNTRFLDQGRVRLVLFDKLDIMENL